MEVEINNMHTLLEETCARIALPSTDAQATARARLDTLTKPLGSLGRLEDLAAQWVSIRRDEFADPFRKAVYVFAADHGVTAEGVSAYPREVTHQMVLNFFAEGAAINVLAKLHHAQLHVVDAGVDADLDGVAGLIHRKIARGTRNMFREAAMTDDELYRALAIGIELANEAAATGHNLIAIGEMGIGNTTSATAITCALTGARPELATGSGTGVDAAVRAHKVAIIEGTLKRHFGHLPHPHPLEILRNVGGLEIAAMIGVVLGAASHRIAILCDGFISTAAAALAVAIAPNTVGYLIAGHESAEPGHRLLLQHLGLTPLLSLNMRLGEGTGAVLAMPIVESAVALYTGMATFASAGVSEVSG
jgi:nicotinate-nucleotide--dimethylbenzimidazole phosphoribosyltransferase